MFVSSVRDQCADDAAADVDKDQVRTVLIELGLLGDMCSSKRPTVVCSWDALAPFVIITRMCSAPLHYDILI